MRIDDYNNGVDYHQVTKVIKEAPPVSIYIKHPSTTNTYTSSEDSTKLIGTMFYPNRIVRVTWNNSLGSSGNCNLSAWHWWVNDVPLFDGDNVITITAYDKYNNIGIDVITISYSALDVIVIITSPTTDSYYNNGINSTITLGGTASYLNLIDSVVWSNITTNGSGNCIGTDNWSIADIGLNFGNNNIIITAYAVGGDNGMDDITVDNYNVYFTGSTQTYSQYNRRNRRWYYKYKLTLKNDSDSNINTVSGEIVPESIPVGVIFIDSSLVWDGIFSGGEEKLSTNEIFFSIPQGYSFDGDVSCDLTFKDSEDNEYTVRIPVSF